jgi:hypothetical protein
LLEFILNKHFQYQLLQHICMKRIFAHIRYILGLFCILSLKGCDSSIQDPDTTLIGFDYFPVGIGTFREYNVRQVDYGALFPNDSVVSIYQLREEITQSFTDIEGRDAYRLVRYRRENSLSAWNRDSIWIIQRTPQYGVRVENNRTFAKLSFPVKMGLKWNGNAYNHFDEDEYEITELDKPYTLNNLSFTKTLKVVQENFIDPNQITGEDIRFEIYAREVGLVHQYIRTLVYCQDLPGESCSDKIDYGIVKEAKLNNYGEF